MDVFLLVSGETFVLCAVDYVHLVANF